MNTPETATIHVALTECLLPSELGQLMDRSKQERCRPGEIIIKALRKYLADNLKETAATSTLVAAAGLHSTGGVH